MSSKRVYKWRYVFGFVHPATGRTEWFITSTVSVAGMSLVLGEFAANVGASSTRRIVLVIDGAGWHTGDDLRVPEGLHLVYLPPYSPELQPSQRFRIMLIPSFFA
jgi:hypothetical protein